MGPRGHAMPRTGGLSRRKLEQQSENMGPHVVPIRNHMGVPAITAPPFSRSRGPAVIDERRIKEIRVVMSPGFVYLGKA